MGLPLDREMTTQLTYGQKKRWIPPTRLSRVPLFNATAFEPCRSQRTAPVILRCSTPSRNSNGPSITAHERSECLNGVRVEHTTRSTAEAACPEHASET